MSQQPENKHGRPDQQPESLSKSIPEDVISTTSLPSKESASLPDVRSSPRLPSLLLPSLPYAKGAQNYFLGEIEDAAEIGLLTFLLHCARKDGLSPKNRRWASLRGAQTMGAAPVVFGSLSVLGVDYRQYGLSPTYPKGFRDAYEVRSENTAEKWTGAGVAVGAVVGTLGARNVAKQFHTRPLPIGIGITVAFASWFNQVGSFVHRGRW